MKNPLPTTNYIQRSLRRSTLLCMSLTLACFALSPRAQAACQNGCLGNRNTALGDDALTNVTAGFDNTAVGDAALKTNSRGVGNTATGRLALSRNINGSSNTATGLAALRDNHFGQGNTATGRDSLLFNTIGNENTATGHNALFSNLTGNNNTATGFNALNLNTTGNFNSAIGEGALHLNTSGDFNSAIGSGALVNNTIGNRNTGIGRSVLPNNTTGNFNVAVGDNAGSGVITADDVICIGHAVAGVNVNGTCFIGNIRGVTTQNGNALPVVIDGAGQLGTASSSQRFKHDIKPMNKTSEAILALNPVTFHYKSDNTGTPQFGLIAEEVAKVNPDLIVRDENGEIYTVRYDAVNAMLLNEFLKEHRRVQELEATVAQQRKDSEATAERQQKQIEALTAGLQKVSAQLEVRKPAPRTVLNAH
jgi:hypothetical protein